MLRIKVTETLNEVLHKLGYAKQKVLKSTDGTHDIVKDNTIVFTGHSGQVWEWLRETKQISFNKG